MCIASLMIDSRYATAYLDLCYGIRIAIFTTSAFVKRLGSINMGNNHYCYIKKIKWGVTSCVVGFESETIFIFAVTHLGSTASDISFILKIEPFQYFTYLNLR